MKKFDNHFYLPFDTFAFAALQRTLRANGVGCLLLLFLFSPITAVASIIILDPATNTQRSIDDSFERGIALQCAEKIKAQLLERDASLKVIISHLPGDTIHEHQSASLSNRMNADLFINLNFYQTTQTKPTLFLYHFSDGNDFAPYQQGLAFNTYEQAYKIHKTTTDVIINECKKHLTQGQYSPFFSVSGPYALPIKPLTGVIAPSISFDIGLKNKDSWHYFVEPLVEAIIRMIESVT